RDIPVNDASEAKDQPELARFWAGRGVGRLFPLSCKRHPKRQNACPSGLYAPAATHWDRTDFLRFDFLEDDMTTFTRLQGLLVPTAVAALGSATMLALLAGNALTFAGASETAAAPSKPSIGPDFPICHAPVTKGAPTMMLRLAQTEVPRAEISAAN